MGSLVKLALDLGDGRSMVHKFNRQIDQPAGLLITLPGDHYGIDGPLLYYPREMMWSKGWDTLGLTYGYQSAGETFTGDKFPQAHQESRAAINLVLEQRDYPVVALVGKSLGAGIVAQLCMQESSLASARAGYITPPLGTPVFDQITGHSSFIAIGTMDRFYSDEAIEKMSRGNLVSVMVIEGADHSMNVAGDLSASLDAVRQVITELVEFLE
jgi:dienelactone hydrolase